MNSIVLFLLTFFKWVLQNTNSGQNIPKYFYDTFLKLFIDLGFKTHRYKNRKNSFDRY